MQEGGSQHGPREQGELASLWLGLVGRRETDLLGETSWGWARLGP